MMWLIFFALCAAGGVFDRMGGSDDYSGQWRRVGVPVCRILAILIYWYPVDWIGWVLLAVSFGAMVGAISTYHYFLPKPKDYTPWHYALHGAMNGVAVIPLAWAGISAWRIILSAVILAVVLWLWDKFFNRRVLCWNSSVVQEFGRGFFILASRIIL